MKKLISIFIVIILSFFMLSSCDNKCSEGHNYIDEIITAPTCTEKGVIKKICNDCGYSYIENVNALDHNIVTLDAVAPTCDTSGLTTGLYCTRCNKVILEQSVIPSNKHKYELIETIDPTCTEHGHNKYGCNVCGNEYSEYISPKGHVEVIDKGYNATCTSTGLSDGSHCAKCGEVIKEQVAIDLLVHSWVSTTIKEPTCDEEGIIQFKCKDCGTVELNTIAPFGHSLIIDPAVEATCTSLGLTEGSHCARCGDVVVAQTETPLAEHTYASTTITPSNCTAEGLVKHECIYCDYTYEETINALGHNVVIDPAVSPSCVEYGLSEGSHCDRCNEVIKEQIIISPTGHNVVIDYELLPTCSTTGLSEGSHCSYCNEIFVKQEIIPMINHSLISYVIYESTCEENGRIFYECENCDYEHIDLIDSLGHDEVIDQQILPTCCDVGYTSGSHCSRCNKTIIERQEIQALGHIEIIDYGYEATCISSGLLNGSHCNRCNEVLVERAYIAPLGHDAVIDQCVDPTCTESGLTEGSHCSRCNEILKEQEFISALGHVKQTISMVLPSCTKTGLSSGTCCGRCRIIIDEQEIIPALGHEHVVTSTEAATCVSEGNITYSCLRCSDSYIIKTEALGHNIVIDSYIAPTCITTGLTEGSHCDRCNYIKIKQETIEALGHEYESSVTLEATCISTGILTHVCKTCNHEYTDIIEMSNHIEVIDESVEATCHSYGKTEGSHCSHCNQIIVEQKQVEMKDHTYESCVTIAPTCTTNGVVLYSCTECGYECEGAIVALGHLKVTISGEAPTCSNPGKSDGVYCSRCNEVLVEQTILEVAHDYEVINFIEPTCLESGYYEYKCKYCDATYEENVAPLNHDYIIVSALDPTCTHTGLTEGSCCSRCNNVLIEQEIIPALGHDVSVISGVNPTCTSPGLQAGKYCDRCEMIVVPQKEISALGHLEVIDEGVLPTCISTGLTEGSHCSRCNEILVEQKVLGMLAHKIVYDYEVQPTCLTNGYTSGTHCESCNLVFKAQEVIPALGHSYECVCVKEATCLDTGQMYYYCSSCNDSYYEDIASLGHDEIIDSYLAPTCSKTGLKEGSHCSRCQTIFIEQEMIPALGHKYVTTVISTPTCTLDGVNKMECSVCNDVIYKTIYKTGHTIVENPYIAPTCSTVGYTGGSHCSVCQAIITEATELQSLYHDYVETITVAPTCTSEGTLYAKCSRCVSHYSLPIASLGHDPITLESTVSTCSVHGKTEGSMCQRCNEILIEQELLPLVDHDFSVIEQVEFSCTSGGIDLYQCINCDFNYELQIPAGHYYEHGLCKGCHLIDESEFNSTYGYETLASWSNGSDLQEFYRDIHAVCKKVHQNYSTDYPSIISDYIYYGDNNLTLNEALYVWRTYRGDNPLWYWFRCSYQYSTVSKYIRLSMATEFQTASERKLYDTLFYNFINRYVPVVEGETNYNKTLYFHDLIINYVDYKYDEDGNPDTSSKAHSIAGILDQTGVVCEGYAWMLDILLEVSNVECVYARGDGHAFNVVKMDDGKWYWFDPTWDDDSDWELGIRYNYFCVNDEQNVRWFGYNYVTITANFLEGHTPYQSSTMNSSAGYMIPERSDTIFKSDEHPVINEVFTVGPNTYSLFGYNKVMLCNTEKTGNIYVNPTVTYKGKVYDVVAIGGVNSSNQHSAKPVFNEGVTSVTIPSSIRYIVDDAFDISTIRYFIVDIQNPNYLALDGVLFTKNKFTLIKYPQAKEDAIYSIPDTVVDVAYNSFLNCAYLQTINAGELTTNYGATNLGYNYRISTNQTYRGYSYKSYLQSNYTLVE